MPRGVPNNRPISTESLPVRGYDVLDMTEPTMQPTGAGFIETVEEGALAMSQADRQAFNEEPIEIRLEPRSERNAPTTVDVAVNGERKWIPVGIPVRIRRKFVEVLARAQPYSVETKVGTAMEERPRNEVVRTPYRLHPFTVLRDENPKGQAWLNKVMFEG